MKYFLAPLIFYFLMHHLLTFVDSPKNFLVPHISKGHVIAILYWWSDTRGFLRTKINAYYSTIYKYLRWLTVAVLTYEYIKHVLWNARDRRTEQGSVQWRNKERMAFLSTPKWMVSDPTFVKLMSKDSMGLILQNTPCSILLEISATN